MEKYYNIAGLNVAMDSYGRTDSRAEAYRIPTPDHVDIQVVSRWPELRDEHPDYSDDLGEHTATDCSFYRQLLDFDGFRFHSSAVVVDGRAYLFSADSGTGKSTHTRLWLSLFGSRAYILNDDKPAVRWIDGTWYACGTPWSGKDDISVNRVVPIAGIAMLERSEHNSIEPYSDGQVVVDMMKQCNRPREMKTRMKQLTLLDKLIREVPVWKLRCNMEPEAAIVSYEAMSGETFKEM